MVRGRLPCSQKVPLLGLSATGGVFSRSRKIRCDSTRPMCQNCIKRGNDCIYDKVPKRRGPDKRPGTRKRSCKKRQSDGSEPQPKKKRRADPVDQDAVTRARFNQYEIAPVALQMFSPAHQTAGKVDTELPTASSSLADATSSFHENYYVKVSPLLPPFFVHPPYSMDNPDSPKRPQSPTSSQPASTSHTLKSEIPPEQPFTRPFESDLHSPETSSYGDPSPHLAGAQVVDKPPEVWWDSLLDAYSPTPEQAWVISVFS